MRKSNNNVIPINNDVRAKEMEKMSRLNNNVMPANNDVEAKEMEKMSRLNNNVMPANNDVEAKEMEKMSRLNNNAMTTNNNVKEEEMNGMENGMKCKELDKIYELIDNARDLTYEQKEELKKNLDSKTNNKKIIERIIKTGICVAGITGISVLTTNEIKNKIIENHKIELAIQETLLRKAALEYKQNRYDTNVGFIKDVVCAAIGGKRIFSIFKLI